jgi:hypothetical protein
MLLLPMLASTMVVVAAVCVSRELLILPNCYYQAWYYNMVSHEC